MRFLFPLSSKAKSSLLDVIKLRGGHTRFGWTLTQWLVSLLEEGSLDRDTEGRRPHEDRDREWSNASTSQRLPEAKKHQGKILPPDPSQRTWPCQHPDCGFPASENVSYFCSFKPEGGKGNKKEKEKKNFSQKPDLLIIIKKLK